MLNHDEDLIYKLIGYESNKHINDCYEEYDSEDLADEEDENDDEFNVISYIKRRPERKYYIDDDNIIKFRNLKEDERPGISEDIIKLAEDKNNFFYFDGHDKILTFKCPNDEEYKLLSKKKKNQYDSFIMELDSLNDMINDIESDTKNIYYIENNYILTRKRRHGEKRGISDDIIDFITKDKNKSFFMDDIGISFFYMDNILNNYPYFKHKKETNDKLKRERELKQLEQQKLNKDEPLLFDDLEYDY